MENGRLEQSEIQYIAELITGPINKRIDDAVALIQTSYANVLAISKEVSGSREVVRKELASLVLHVEKQELIAANAKEAAENMSKAIIDVEKRIANYFVNCREDEPARVKKYISDGESKKPKLSKLQAALIIMGLVVGIPSGITGAGYFISEAISRSKTYEEKFLQIAEKIDRLEREKGVQQNP